MGGVGVEVGKGRAEEGEVCHRATGRVWYKVRLLGRSLVRLGGRSSGFVYIFDHLLNDCCKFRDIGLTDFKYSICI